MKNNMVKNCPCCEKQFTIDEDKIIKVDKLQTSQTHTEIINTGVIFQRRWGEIKHTSEFWISKDTYVCSKCYNLYNRIIKTSKVLAISTYVIIIGIFPIVGLLFDAAWFLLIPIFVLLNFKRFYRFLDRDLFREVLSYLLARGINLTPSLNTIQRNGTSVEQINIEKQIEELNKPINDLEDSALPF